MQNVPIASAVFLKMYHMLSDQKDDLTPKFSSNGS